MIVLLGIIGKTHITTPPQSSSLYLVKCSDATIIGNEDVGFGGRGLFLASLSSAVVGEGILEHGLSNGTHRQSTQEHHWETKENDSLEESSTDQFMVLSVSLAACGTLTEAWKFILCRDEYSLDS